jgi:quercetin dioxygenase-like cupin family protein
MDLKPFEPASIMNFINLVEYSSDGIISKRILEKTTGNITLFSFDQGQKLSEHTAPFDAMVQILEGESEISINRKAYTLKAGESIIMPADIPHAVFATTKFKMLLTMIKGK